VGSAYRDLGVTLGSIWAPPNGHMSWIRQHLAINQGKCNQLSGEHAADCRPGAAARAQRPHPAPRAAPHEGACGPQRVRNSPSAR